MSRFGVWRNEWRTLGLRRFLLRRWRTSQNEVARRLLPARPLGPADSTTPVDVVIPVIAKDRAVLPHVARALRANLRHPLGEICLIAPDCPELRKLAAAEGCRFVLETDVLPRPAPGSFVVRGMDRTGWLYQQLLKLSADQLCAGSHILIADADTVWLQPHCFVRGDQSALLFSEEFHLPYYTTYQRLIGQPAGSVVSFVGHYMLVQSKHLAALKAAIAARHARPWWQAVLGQVDPTVRSAFSEFETYGNFVLAHAPDSIWLEPARNLRLPLDRLGELPALAGPLSHQYRSLSFHTWA